MCAAARPLRRRPGRLGWLPVSWRCLPTAGRATVSRGIRVARLSPTALSASALAVPMVAARLRRSWRPVQGFEPRRMSRERCREHRARQQQQHSSSPWRRLQGASGVRSGPTRAMGSRMSDSDSIATGGTHEPAVCGVGFRVCCLSACRARECQNGLYALSAKPYATDIGRWDVYLFIQ